MRIAKLIALILGFVVAGIGVLGVFSPTTLLEFARSLLTTTALYIIAAMRVAFGAILVFVAPTSRVPKMLRVLGVVIIVAGAATPFFGVERSRAMLEWWSMQDPWFTRGWTFIAVVFGVFIIYAISSSRRSAP